MNRSSCRLNGAVGNVYQLVINIFMLWLNVLVVWLPLLAGAGGLLFIEEISAGVIFNDSSP